MVSQKRSQLGAGVVLSYLSQALQILITLVYTPVMLRLLGQSQYGLYQLVFSVVSYLSLMTFGFSSAYIKFYSTAKIEEDSTKAVAKINGMFMTVFCILGLLVLFLGFMLCMNPATVLGDKLTSEELATGQVLMIILVINCALHFPSTVFNNFIIANEKFICLQALNLLSIVLNPCLTFPMLLAGYKSLSLSVALLFITVLKLIISAYYCLVKLKMKISYKNLEFTIFKDIGKFSFFIFVESVISTINISLDRFLLGRMVGSISVALYSVGGQINTLYTTLSTSISSVFTPRINGLVAIGNKDKELSEIFIKVGKIQFAVLYLILIGFTVFGKRFINLWAGEGYESAFYVALVLIWPNTINLIQNIAIEIQRAMGLQKYRSLMYAAIAIMNIIISLFFIRLWNEVGAALGTCVAWIVGSGIVMNWFYAKKVGLDIKRFWWEIASMSKVGIPLFIGFLLLGDFINYCNIAVYFLLIVLFTLIYLLLMFFCGLRYDEKTFVLSKVRRILKITK